MYVLRIITDSFEQSKVMFFSFPHVKSLEQASDHIIAPIVAVRILNDKQKMSPKL